MSDSAFTFDDKFRAEAAEALVPLIEYVNANRPEGEHSTLSFVKGVLFGAVGYDQDGEPAYELRFLGGAQLLEMMGLAQAIGLWIAREFQGGPTPNTHRDLVDDDDD